MIKAKSRDRRRKTLRTVLCVIGALLGSARPSRAQVAPPRTDSTKREGAKAEGGAKDSVTTDSLTARLERAEAAIALLQKQLATEAASAVRTRSRLQLELSGRILTNSYYTSGRANSVELPLFVREPVPFVAGGQTKAGTKAFGMTLRQSFVGAALSVDSVLGGTLVADIDVDFFGGGTAYTADPFGFPQIRLRTVNAQLRWTNTAIMVGSETPLISDVNPVSLAAAGTPEFATSGNLWNWIPQIRLSQTVARTMLGATPLTWSLQGAVLAPAAGLRSATEPDGIDAGERSARPAIEGRASLKWGAPDALDDRSGEVGVGFHRGWLRATSDSLIIASALAADARVGLTHGLTLLAEAYTGRAISSLGGGGIGQSFGVAAAGDLIGPPIRNVAGWAQLNAQLHPTVATGVGCGLDVANERDLPRRTRNGACEVHMIWRPTQPILVGFEVRRLGTRYATGTEHATHFNLALGFEW
jgi:hypothetical protein